MMRGETVLTGAAQPMTELEMLSSPQGYYVGFLAADGSPYSRETPYFDDPEMAMAVRLIMTRLDWSELVALRDVLASFGMVR